MKNTKENAEQFIWNFGNGKSFVDRLQGIPDFVELLTQYGGKVENQYIPNDAHSFEVFAIKDSEDSPTGKQAFIGFKLDNGNFHFIGVPYTEPIKVQQNWFSKIFKSFNDKLKLKR
jgi:hypothetical protein